MNYLSKLATVCREYEDPILDMLDRIHCELQFSGTALNEHNESTYTLIISASICEHSANPTDTTTQNV